MAFFRFVWRYFLMGTARRIEKKIREKYFQQLQDLPMSFFSHKNGGDLMTRGVNDIENIINYKDYECYFFSELTWYILEDDKIDKRDE